jgi:hypothetical protein
MEKVKVTKVKGIYNGDIVVLSLGNRAIGSFYGTAISELDSELHIVTIRDSNDVIIGTIPDAEIAEPIEAKS